MSPSHAQKQTLYRWDTIAASWVVAGLQAHWDISQWELVQLVHLSAAYKKQPELIKQGSHVLFFIHLTYFYPEVWCFPLICVPPTNLDLIVWLKKRLHHNMYFTPHPWWNMSCDWRRFYVFRLGRVMLKLGGKAGLGLCMWWFWQVQVCRKWMSVNVTSSKVT